MNSPERKEQLRKYKEMKDYKMQIQKKLNEMDEIMSGEFLPNIVRYQDKDDIDKILSPWTGSPLGQNSSNQLFPQIEKDNARKMQEKMDQTDGSAADSKAEDLEYTFQK